MTKTQIEGVTGLAALLAIMSSPAVAQNGPWTFDATSFLWINDTGVTADTPRGELSAELSFSNAIDALDFAYMEAEWNTDFGEALGFLRPDTWCEIPILTSYNVTHYALQRWLTCAVATDLVLIASGHA